MPLLTPNDPDAPRCSSCRYWWHDGRLSPNRAECRRRLPAQGALGTDGCGEHQAMAVAEDKPKAKASGKNKPATQSAQPGQGALQ